MARKTRKRSRRRRGAGTKAYKDCIMEQFKYHLHYDAGIDGNPSSKERDLLNNSLILFLNHGKGKTGRIIVQQTDMGAKPITESEKYNYWKMSSKACAKCDPAFLKKIEASYDVARAEAYLKRKHGKAGPCKKPEPHIAHEPEEESYDPFAAEMAARESGACVGDGCPMGGRRRRRRRKSRKKRRKSRKKRRRSRRRRRR